jgi:two-component system chemotaxis response regulator CheB
MGRDGAEELKRMKERGAVTIVQNRETSVVPGMPGEAIKLDAATYVLPPEKIAAALRTLVTKGDLSKGGGRS